MCGLAGFIGEGSEADLKKMIGALKHRGPDSQGLFFDKEIAFAHARLSILDTSSAGNQPMFSEDKKICLIFNGEIYNFLELRNDLEVIGHTFKSDSDTEVILAAYREFGDNCFEKFEGMFAIAIYDFLQEKLILARDRIGEKPLYWTLIDETLVFASELAAMTLHPLFKKEIDFKSLSKFLSFDYCPTPHTIYKNVYKLEAGKILIWDKKEVKKKSFWNMNFEEKEISFKDAVRELDEKLNETSKKVLLSDVPLGVFLSGGLDSSTIAYYASKNSRAKINTYSIGFEEKSFDESYYAQKVAKFLGTNHHTKIVTQSDIINLVKNLGDLLDEPLADPSIIPTYILSKFARENVTVALGGDGGDELFAGYPTFQAELFADLYLKLPKKLRNILEKIVNKMPVSDKNFSLEFKLKKFIKGLKSDKKYRHQNWLGNFNHDEKSQLFLPAIWKQIEHNNVFEDIDKYIADNKIADPRQKALFLYMKTYLMDQVLVKVDRASMKTSLEVRAPFLNHKIVDFVNALPYKYKFKGMTGKYILKQLMKDKIPTEIINRKKKGFGIPISKWLREDLKELCEKLLSKEEIEKSNLFNYEFIKKLKEGHFNKRENNARKLWSLMIFQLWYSHAEL